MSYARVADPYETMEHVYAR